MSDTFTLSTMPTIKFEWGSTFKQFVKQFQPHCAQLLCIVTEIHPQGQTTETLVFYQKKDQLPKNTHFVHHDHDLYIFASLDNLITYCVFGYPAACIFYPHFDSITDTATPVKNNEINNEIKEVKEVKKPVIIEYIGDTVDVIKIVHQGRKLEFPKPNKMVEIKKVKVFEMS